jgi:outer membrane biosynthesis protein TonB
MTLQMDEQDREWKARFASIPRTGSAGSCPRAEMLSTWAKGPLPDDAVPHLAACFNCREELIDVRRRLTEKGQTEAPRRALYALMPARRLPYGWIAAAAVLVVAILLAGAFSRTETPKQVVVQPPVKEKPQPPPTPRETQPPAPLPAPKPQEKPVAPAPSPEKAPAPPPAPVKETPAVAKPAPAPVKPLPTIPEKPAPVLTRAQLKGTVLGVAGVPSTQIEADPWQPLRAGQSRDFTGSVKIKADIAATKLRAGAATFYLQRGGEIAFTMEEGRTRVTLARGEAFFDVTPGREPFEVETAQGVVTVKGTRFLVATDKNETEVVVQRGAVQFNAVAIAAGERSNGGAPQKADLAKRLAWVRALEDSIWIETDQMALSGGMAILPDPVASGGRMIGVKDPLKAGQEAAAEIRAKRKQPGPYAVWVRLHWSHNVPSALTLSVGDALHWTSKDVTANPKWQWVRAGSGELPDEAFRVRLTDTQPGMRIDQILITSDLEFSPEQDKK